MTIRPLQWSDFRGWAELYLSRFEEVRSNPELGVFTMASPPSLGAEAALFGTIQKAILDGDHVAFVAEEGGRVVGHANVTRKGKHVEDAHIGVLGMAVLPEWRGRGIGNQLMTPLLEACRGKFEIVQLSVIDANVRAQALYRKHGFVESGREPMAFKRGDRYFDEILMWRSIGVAGNR